MFQNTNEYNNNHLVTTKAELKIHFLSPKLLHVRSSTNIYTGYCKHQYSIVCAITNDQKH